MEILDYDAAALAAAAAEIPGAKGEACDVGDAAAEKVSSVNGRAIGNIGSFAKDAEECSAAIKGFVEAHLRFARRRETAAVHGRRTVPRNRCADKDVVGVRRIDCDRSD